MFKKYLLVFLISMVPLIELRGAIPYAVGFNLNMWIAYAIAIIGNMVPVPIIFFFARKVLEWGKDKKIIGKFFTFCLEKGDKAGKKLQEKTGRGVYWALFLGTLAASLLDLDFKKSVFAIVCGVVLAGVIMGAASLGLFSAIGVR